MERLPFDELASRYANEPEEVWREFHRRLHRIVLYAAADFTLRTSGTAMTAAQEVDEANRKTKRVFEEFAPQFAAGDESRLLRRFATIIRRMLDNEAFEYIAHRYYYQLPIYYVEDKDQRQVLVACYEVGLKAPLAMQISERLIMTVEEARRLIEAGNESLRQVIEKDFTTEELAVLTEGYVP